MSARLVASAGATGFRFVHDLVRQTLIAILDEQPQRHRHAAIVRAMTSALEPERDVLAAQVADHAWRGLQYVDSDTAVRLLVAAARHASRRLAVEEACVHYARRWSRSI